MFSANNNTVYWDKLDKLVGDYKKTKCGKCLALITTPFTGINSIQQQEIIIKQDILVQR